MKNTWYTFPARPLTGRLRGCDECREEHAMAFNLLIGCILLRRVNKNNYYFEGM